MITKTKEHIIGYININKQARVSELVRALKLSPVAIHKQLKKLLQAGILQKIGTAPHVFYVLEEKKKIPLPVTVSQAAKKVLDKNYLYISPQGAILYGIAGFTKWAANTNQSAQISRLSELYVKTRMQYDEYRKPEGWIDATFKLSDTFPQNYLDRLLYADFYSLPQFGKTKFGALMLYAKQSQNRELINNISISIQPMAQKIINHFKIDAVAYVPPSIPRTIQFMNEFAINLKIARPQINLVKIRTGEVIVAQKTLEKLEERIVNARETIFVKDTKLPFARILLIDDAVGSGASMNETAKKMKDILARTGQTAVKIIGFAIVGSFKGFEVIREV